MKGLLAVVTVGLVLGAGSAVWAQGEETPPPSGEEAAPPAKEENGKPLAERKRAFMDSFSRRLSGIRKDETSPERKEIARLEDLKKDYKEKLDTSENDLNRSKKVVIDSFKKLVTRNKDKDDVEARCETMWLDYLRQSRDKKSSIFEYRRALKGLDRRINFIRKREVERELPGLDYQKYYTVDNLEVYSEDEGLDLNVFGGKKSHVSYYAMLKDFVLEMSGGGRGDDRVVEKYVEEPPLVALWKDWKRRAPREKAGEE
ncbi:MAG: hypothetical protein ACYTFG_22510 [Planctomycetota bacterium]|jgi:hypothetical protein